jgi:Fe-S oxidoreductase
MDNQPREELEVILRKRQSFNCIECGKCSSVCPIGILNRKYYPRIILRKAIHEKPDVMRDGLMWSCLSCGLCDQVCELDVRFYEFIRDLRAESHKLGMEPVFPPHAGGPHAWMGLMTSPELRQNRLDWITDGLKCSDKGEVLYFVGCLPYYDRYFTHLNADTLNIARSTVRILNHLGIEPVVMENERCCGHDFLWGGNVEDFTRLAELNMSAINSTGAKRVVTACAECYYTLKKAYPEHVGKWGVEVLHLSQFLVGSVGDLSLNDTGKRMTFQDPCRLGRLSGIYEEPRNILKSIEGVELLEMERNRNSAVCCGTSGWQSCGTYSKQIQTVRLKEAKKTGAEVLITSCPKCELHFKCALSDEKTHPEARIDIQDLAILVADSLK